MKISISDDGKGGWNLFAREGDDETAPFAYTALGRSAWAIKALVYGILTDHRQDPADREAE